MKNTGHYGLGEPSAEFPWVIIEKLRRMKAVPKKKLAAKLRMNYSYLVDLLNGRYSSKIDSQKLQIISEMLNIPTKQLLEHFTDRDILISTEKETIKISNNAPEPSNLPGFQIPLIKHHSEEVIPGFIKLISLPADERKSGLEILECYNPRYLNESDALAVKLEDDSMFPPFRAETVFIAGMNKTARLNDLVFVVIRDERSWLREYYTMEPDVIILKPYNPKYDYLKIFLKDIIAMYPIVGVEIKG